MYECACGRACVHACVRAYVRVCRYYMQKNTDHELPRYAFGHFSDAKDITE